MSEVTQVRKSLGADVVVIGSGGAGLCAAAAARRAGAKVLLLTKGKAGVANCTAWAGGGFTVSPPAEAVSGLLTPEEHFRLSLDTGRGLNNRELLGELCHRGTQSLQELERDFGVRLDWGERGCSVRRFGREPLLGGIGLTAPLLAHLERVGVEIIEGAVAREIIRDPRGEVRGVTAVAVDESLFGTGTPAEEGQTAVMTVDAVAVVVATGGGGAIYGRTDNPPRMTGDGYRILAGAGAILEDMEFVQFYPLGVAEPGLPSRLLDAGLLGIVPLTDEAGQDPLAGKFREWGIDSGEEANLYARDLIAVTLARHIAAGHRLYLHTEEMPAADVPREHREIYLEVVRGSLPPSFDPFARPVRVAPTQHYFCGGAVITKAGEVLGRDRRPIPGLFACGEVTSGVDGANRVGGNALTNIVVFGLAAGRRAAEHAGERRVAGEAASASARLSFRFSSEGPSPASLRSELHTLCDEGLGPVRSAKKLEETLAGLADLERRAATARVRSRSDLLLALELDSAVATATYVARSALTRSESRGAHFRDDYPGADESWSQRHVSPDF